MSVGDGWNRAVKCLVTWQIVWSLQFNQLNPIGAGFVLHICAPGFTRADAYVESR